MTALAFLLLIPVGAALLLTVVPNGLGALLNITASAATLASSCALLLARPPATALWLVDDFNGWLIALTSFVTLTTAVFSAGHMAHEVATGRLSHGGLRIYHALFQALSAALLLALVANNIGLLWVAIEAATLVMIAMVGLYRTRAAIEAAWKYFILASVSIALALFGTVLVYLAAQPIIGSGLAAMAWTALQAQAKGFSPAVLNLAFVFLLVGYGTKVGLAPLHAWLPDAYAAGPVPAAALSGLLLNVALYALLRFKMVLAAGDTAATPGRLMMALGLGSLLFGGLMLYRRRDLKRLFAYSSIEHMGILAIAFGFGGALANLAGLLLMASHCLVKSSIFFAVGRIVQLKGTSEIAGVAGLTASHPLLGWGLVLGVIALAGAPPSGIFAAEFLVVTSGFAVAPALALLLALGLLIAVAALLLRLQPIAFGSTTPSITLRGSATAVLPLYAHLALVLVGGLWLPASLVGGFSAVARLLG